MRKKSVIVSLTTIPSRLPSLHQTIESILNQDTKATRIELNIPDEYRRENLGKPDLSHVPDGVDVHRVQKDYGPATKVLPTIERYKNTDTAIVFCDDDTIYDPDWLTRLTTTSERYPDCVIADRARATAKWEARARWRNKGWEYYLRKAISLGLWTPVRSTNYYTADVAEGIGGVLIKPHFFDDSVFEIPDIFWTVDDVWLSGMALKNGYSIKATGFNWRENQQAVHDAQGDVSERDALHNMVYKDHNRMDANLACVAYFRKTYGVFVDTHK